MLSTPFRRWMRFNWAFLSAMTLPGIAQTVSFNQPVSYPVGCRPTGDAETDDLVFGDFNGDGKRDLAILCGNQVSILLGKGDGTFQAPRLVDIPTTLGALRYLRAADLNHDGYTDLTFTALLMGTGGVFGVLISNGDGSFREPLVQPASDLNEQRSFVDLNGDGIPDLISLQLDSSKFPISATPAVRLGKGDGTFAAPVNLPAMNGSGGIVAGDFNGDGKPDIVFSSADAGSFFYPGKGDGTFLASVKITPEGGAPFAADFNGDGKVDLGLVITNPDQTLGIHTFLGNGDGTFQAPVVSVSRTRYSLFATGDLNGDGKADLAASVPEIQAVNIFLSKGDGTASFAVGLNLGTMPGQLVIADFNGDGKPDIVTANGASRDVSVLINTTVFSGHVSTVLNGASFAGNQPITQGSLVTIFGTVLSSSSPALAGSIPLPLSLGGVSVTFNGVPAPLTYVSSTQINAQAPWGLLPGNATVVVTVNGQALPSFSSPVGPFSPGIFSAQSGVGQAIAINPDGSLAGPAGSLPGVATRPARVGDALVIFATGLGAVDSAIDNGVPSSDRLRNTMTLPEVLIGGQSAQVPFSGLTPQFVGVNQINVIVPSVPGLGVVPLQIRVGGITTTNKVTIAVQNP